MSRHFTATVLLERPWPIDADRIARALTRQFPRIGVIDATPGQSTTRDSAVITIDGANIVLVSVDEPVPGSELKAPAEVLRTWNPQPALRTHQAWISVTAGGRMPGLEGAVSYAAATHFVAAACATVAPAGAVLWRASWAVMAPGDFGDAARSLNGGQMPIDNWVSFAPVVPRGWVAARATGMVTYGLRPFIGRELELAPAPGDAGAARARLAAVVRRVFERGLSLREGPAVGPRAHFSAAPRRLGLRAGPR